MNERTPGFERVPTGIAGLDFILEGGLPEGGVYIIHGPPGAGKTILGNQACFHQARQGRHAIYVTLLAESHARLVGHLRRMSFFDPTLVPEHVQYISVYKPLEDEGLHGLVTLLRHALVSSKASLLVVDGIVSAEEVSLSWPVGTDGDVSSRGRDATSAVDFKKFIHELQTIAAMTGCTVLLLGSTERPRAFHPAYTMVDGIIELTDDLHRLRPVRHINVRKMRGVNQRVGRHIYEIDDDGLVVRPRIETQVKPSTAAQDEGAGPDVRCRFGIRGLDEMLRGGLPSMSMTMLLGPTGSGKTMLGAHFLAEGIRRGEPGVYFGFHERPDAVVRKSARLGSELGAAVKGGQLSCVWQPVSEGIVDVLAERLFDALQRTKAKRLFIDSMHGFYRALDDYPERIAGVLSAMSDKLQQLGVTTVYSVETTDVFGPQIEVPQPGISQATQNLILLRHVELGSRLHLLLAVVKVRDSIHDRSVRELCFTDDGLEVTEFEGNPGHVLATSSLHPVGRARGGNRKKNGNGHKEGA